MGGAVGPTLAAAVSNAGGLGMLVPRRADIDTVRRQIRDRAPLTRLAEFTLGLAEGKTRGLATLSPSGRGKNQMRLPRASRPVCAE
jgi:hypothetical protein